MSTYTTTSIDDSGSSEVPPQSIKEFFHGRSIFITGGTGFLGKVLVEKLLRSCSSLNTIYLLIRSKKGINTNDRLKFLTDDVLFGCLKQVNPNALLKLQVVTGDITQVGLGLAVADRQTLEENVSVVIHSAASIRFDDALKDAIIMNTRGTLEVVKLASCMKQLKTMIHISTTYCNLDHQVVPEHVLPPHGNWRTFIEAGETTDRLTLDILTKKILSFYPNTYTFSKSLAESIINDYRDKIPLIIIRPSVVTPTLYDPFPGWINTLNGPCSLNIAVGKGILRTMCENLDTHINYIPVDLVCKAILIAARQRAFQGPLSEVPVYNAAGDDQFLTSQHELAELGQSVGREYPLNGSIYWPWFHSTKSLWVFYILFPLLHIPQSLMVDTILWLSGKAAVLLRLHRKVYRTILALQPFLQNEWQFINHNFLRLEELLHPEEEKEFGYQLTSYMQYNYFKSCLFGVSKYVLKEELNVKKNQKHLERLFIVHCVFCTLLLAALGWMLYTFPLHITIFSKLGNAVRCVLIV